MATIINCPVRAPHRYPRQTAEKAKEEDTQYVKEVIDWCQENGRGPLKGRIIEFTVGDGFARYVVYSAASVVYLNTTDGYQIPAAHMRGLFKRDIASMVECYRHMQEMGARPL